MEIIKDFHIQLRFICQRLPFALLAIKNWGNNFKTAYLYFFTISAYVHFNNKHMEASINIISAKHYTRDICVRVCRHRRIPDSILGVTII